MSTTLSTPLTYNQYLKKWNELAKEMRMCLKICNYKKLNELIKEESNLTNHNINFLRANFEQIEDLYYEIILDKNLKF